MSAITNDDEDAPERGPFEPLGDASRKRMVLDGIDTIRPLTPRTLITYEMISTWLGEEFPIARSRYNGRFVVPDYGPMTPVKTYLLKNDGILLVNEENVGYWVATEQQKLEEAEKRWKAAADDLDYVHTIARSIRCSVLPPNLRRQLTALMSDTRAELRSLAAQRKERLRIRDRLW